VGWLGIYRSMKKEACVSLRWYEKRTKSFF
jgi:hypothetical protein